MRKLILFFCLVNSSLALAGIKCKPREEIGHNCDYANIVFNPRNEWQEIKVKFLKGINYRFVTRLSNDWKDWNEPADLNGWKKHKTLAKIYSVARRYRPYGFYQLIMCESKKYKECKLIDRTRKNFVFNKDTTIIMFVNDARGFAFNNKGKAFIRVEKHDRVSIK